MFGARWIFEHSGDESWGKSIFDFEKLFFVGFTVEFVVSRGGGGGRNMTSVGFTNAGREVVEGGALDAVERSTFEKLSE